MSLKKIFADFTKTAAFEVMLMSSVALTGGYIAVDNDDIINDTVSPHRVEVMKRVDNIFNVIDKSVQSLNDNKVQREIILLEAIATPTDELKKARRINYKASIKTRNEVKAQSTMLADRIINSTVFNEVDFMELAGRFNEKGLDEYSGINFEDVDGRYRDECVLEEKKELNEKSSHVLECIVNEEEAHFAGSFFTMMFLWSAMYFSNISKTISKSDTLEKWRRETPRKKNRSIN